MNKPEPVYKIALFVEDDVDKVIINTFVKKILSSSVNFRFFRKRPNIAAFHSTYINIVELLPKGYQHFFLLFSTNTTEEPEIVSDINLIARPMKEYGLLEDVTFCPIVPNMNAWLSGHYELPKKEFGQEFDLSKIQAVAGKIDINELKQKNASFNQFVKALQQWEVQNLVA